MIRKLTILTLFLSLTLCWSQKQIRLPADPVYLKAGDNVQLSIIGNVITVASVPSAAGGGITTFNGLNSLTQTVSIDSASNTWKITSSGSTHTIGFPGTRLVFLDKNNVFSSVDLTGIDSLSGRVLSLSGSATVGLNLSVSGLAYVDSILNLIGPVTVKDTLNVLKDLSVTGTGTFGNILPASDGVGNVGMSSLRWNSGYFSDSLSTVALYASGSGTFGGDLAVNGDDITSDGALTITSSGGDITLSASGGDISSVNRIGLGNIGTTSAIIVKPSAITSTPEFHFVGQTFSGSTTFAVDSTGRFGFGQGRSTTSMGVIKGDNGRLNLLELERSSSDTPVFSVDSSANTTIGGTLALAGGSVSVSEFAMKPNSKAHFSTYYGNDGSTIKHRVDSSGTNISRFAIIGADSRVTGLGGLMQVRTDFNSVSGADTVLTVFANYSSSTNTQGTIVLASTGDVHANTNGQVRLHWHRRADGSNDFMLLQSPGGAAPDTTLYIDASTGRTSLWGLDVFGSLTASGSGTFGGDVAVNGDDITSDGDLTITPAGGDIIIPSTVSLDVNATVADTSAFTTTATRAAVYIAGALSTDKYIVSHRNATGDDTLPVAGDQLSYYAKADSLIVLRAAGTTSGQKFSYVRLK